MRELNRLSLSDVHEITGLSRAQISKIENGKCDPRISTVTRLLSCYGASLGDLESDSASVMTLGEMKERSRRASETLARLGLGASDPVARLGRKAELGSEFAVEERRALATRS